MSGLVAARELTRAGVDVLVVESADRVGGRTLVETTALGSHVDVGGQWIGHDHHEVIALADELGLTRYPMRTTAVPGVVEAGTRLPLLSWRTLRLLPAVAALGVVGLLSLVRPTERWSGTTLDRWISRVPGASARRLLELGVQISWTTDPDRMSVHAALRMIREQGGLRTMLSTLGGAQDSLVVEGLGAVAQRLAAELGDRVVLGRQVLAVTRSTGEVVVETTDGQVRAEAVVITVPPPVARAIRHDPPLDPERQQIQDSSQMGTVYKALAVYERPFWRERAEAELVVLDAPGRAVFDSGPPDGPGHLCFLAGGEAARELDALDEEGRREALLGPLAPMLGAAVTSPVGWHEKSWHLDEHVGGGYMSLPEPGTTAGSLPTSHMPAGRVHWSGTETAQEHAGYVEGAIVAGRRVAEEVAQALRDDAAGSAVG